MDTLPYLLAAAVLATLAAAAWYAVAKPRPTLPYARRCSLLSTAELRFYRALLQAVAPGTEVFVKVRLMDVVTVPDDAWKVYGAPGSGMHLDFVLADASTIAPRLVIELDDSSHAHPETQRRDAFKNSALGSACIPILRIVAAGRYDVVDLQGRIKRAMGR